MSLIKKTIILSKENAKGFVTIVKVGSSAGIKVVFNVPITKQLLLGIKIDNMPQFNCAIEKNKIEYEISSDFQKADAVGVIVIDERGELFAEGGRKGTVNYNELLASGSVPQVSTAQNTPTETPVQLQETGAKIVHIGDINKPNATTNNTPENVTAAKAEANVADSAESIPEAPREEAPTANVIPNAQKVDPTTANGIPNAPNIEPPTVKFDSVNKPVPPTAENNAVPPTPPMIDITPTDNFFQSIRLRLEDIFTINPKEATLETLIPDSKWVKIYYDGDDYYVVGMLIENDVVTHIAYGVPGLQSVKPPKEAMELCDFLATTDAAGYWLMFQNATNGKIVKI